MNCSIILTKYGDGVPPLTTRAIFPGLMTPDKYKLIWFFDKPFIIVRKKTNVRKK